MRSQPVLIMRIVALCLSITSSTKSLAQDPSKNVTAPANSKATLGVCYSPEIPVEKLLPFGLVVVDSTYPWATQLKSKDRVVLGYLSLGKVQRFRPWFAQLEQAKALAGIDTNSTADPTSEFAVFHIDVSNPKWTELVLDLVIPEIAKGGFDGLLLDDLDDIYQRKLDQSAVALMGKIRERFPRLKLLANRGLEYSAAFAAKVDYLLLESCFAEKGRLRPASDTEWALGLLKKALAVNPRLIPCALDYYAASPIPIVQLDTQRLTLIKEISARHQAAQLVSGVTDSSLQSAPIHPSQLP